MKRGEIGHSSKHGSGSSNTEPDAFITDFPSTAPPVQLDHGLQPSPLSTMRRSNLDTLRRDSDLSRIPQEIHLPRVVTHRPNDRRYLLRTAKLAIGFKLFNMELGTLSNVFLEDIIKMSFSKIS